MYMLVWPKFTANYTLRLHSKVNFKSNIDSSSNSYRLLCIGPLFTLCVLWKLLAFDDSSGLMCNVFHRNLCPLLAVHTTHSHMYVCKERALYYTFMIITTAFVLSRR